MVIPLVGNLIGENNVAKTNNGKISLEIVNFDREMKRVRREVKDLANKEIDDKINYAVRTLRTVTPIDTGEARSGWFKKTYTAVDGYHEAYIINPVDHVSYLNNGHSKQAPRYFIEQVLLTIGIITPN